MHRTKDKTNGKKLISRNPMRILKFILTIFSSNNRNIIVIEIHAENGLIDTLQNLPNSSKAANSVIFSPIFT
jgi:hypothetical protein